MVGKVRNKYLSYCFKMYIRTLDKWNSHVVFYWNLSLNPSWWFRAAHDFSYVARGFDQSIREACRFHAVLSVSTGLWITIKFRKKEEILLGRCKYYGNQKKSDTFTCVFNCHVVNFEFTACIEICISIMALINKIYSIL